MNKKTIGTLVGTMLLLGVIVVGIFIYMDGARNPDITINGLVGGEKIPLLENEKFKEIAKEKYNTTVEFAKSGSIEMVDRDVSEMDYLFPSSQVAGELIKNKHGEQMTRSETVLNSPIVFISWGEIVDAFEKQGIVEKENDAYYMVDTKEFLQLIAGGATWEEVGVPSLYGDVSIISTDPAKSNSGNMFAGLLANMMNDGKVVTEAELTAILPEVEAFFSKLGYLENSSGDLFEQFLKTGMGAKPIIAGYENQLIEFATQNPETWERVKDNIRIIYPTPTVWSEHPIIALNAEGERLIEILSDPEVQELAWKEHGFRTGLSGIENNPDDVKLTGLPETIKSIIPMPTPHVMDEIINRLK